MEREIKVGDVIVNHNVDAGHPLRLLLYMGSNYNTDWGITGFMATKDIVAPIVRIIKKDLAKDDNYEVVAHIDIGQMMDKAYDEAKRNIGNGNR